jgi:hypothetical protein
MDLGNRVVDALGQAVVSKDGQAGDDDGYDKPNAGIMGGGGHAAQWRLTDGHKLRRGRRTAAARGRNGRAAHALG